MALNKGCLLFVEGDTEKVFYELLIEELMKKNLIVAIKTPFIIKNLKGIGGFKRIATRYYQNEVLPKYRNTQFSIGLAYDTDVFEYDRQPIIDWQKVDANFKKNGAIEIVHVRQKSMIEDVFLEDYQGVLKFLNLPKNSKIPKGNGYEKLQLLFNRANKIYYKGYLCKKLLKNLDLIRIYQKREDVLYPLVRILNI